MSIRSFLRKELAWGRRRLIPLFLLFLLLPASFAYVSTGFDNVLPTDTPVGLVADSETVTEDDMAITRGAVTFFSDPRTFESNRSAIRALEREQVYAVVTVPPDVTNASVNSTFQVTVHGSMVPYHQPSEAVVNVLRLQLEEVLSGSVQIERRIVGMQHSLSAYLVPTFLVMLVMIIALGYLPYNLAAERPVLDRIRIESSLETLVASKLAFFGTLLLVPMGVFGLASLAFGYQITITPTTVLASVLLFVILGSLGCAVVIATRFSTWGYLLNLLTLFGLSLFSGLLYPAGFFSPVRRDVVRLLPTHYTMIIVRGSTLRNAGIGEYTWWLVGFGVLCLLSLGLLKGAIAVYERGT